MKGKSIFGALLVSVALCGQGFGYELLDNLLGLNRGGCGPCQPAACEPAAVAACDPACAACEPAAVAACDPACSACNPCGKPKCCRPRIRPVRDLFDGLEDLARCRLAGDCSKCKLLGPCKQACNTACCEPAAIACAPVAACVPACEPVAIACDPVAVCDPVAACDPGCGPAGNACGKSKSCKPRCRPVLDLLENLFGRKCCPKPKKSCGPMACAPAAFDGCGGCGVMNGGATPAPTTEEAAPLPPAPKADPSASIIRPRQLHTASRTLAQY